MTPDDPIARWSQEHGGWHYAVESVYVDGPHWLVVVWPAAPTPVGQAPLVVRYHVSLALLLGKDAERLPQPVAASLVAWLGTVARRVA